jgi:hypothetical protein
MGRPAIAVLQAALEIRGSLFRHVPQPAGCVARGYVYVVSRGLVALVRQRQNLTADPDRPTACGARRRARGYRGRARIFPRGRNC